ncbi:MAG TPA: hypothetical protein PLW55_04925 [Leptospiraceae bacterium]|nr:hypothetical protein [Leptospiraceae bacterium]
MMKAFWFSLQFFFLLAACKAYGPPYAGIAAGDRIPDSIAATTYAISIPQTFYRISQKAELTFERSGPTWTYFDLRIVGQNPIASIRVHSYEGKAFMTDGVLELRTEKCYERGKKDWEDRLTPLDGWDCEHLWFQLVELAPGSGIFQSARSDRTQYSDWIGSITAVPLSRATFSGQILTTLPDQSVIVYGKNAGRLLRDGMTLEAREVDLLPLGRPAKKDQTTGTLKVISRPGDFIVAQWEGTPAPANAAFSFAPRPAKSMFD